MAVYLSHLLIKLCLDTWPSTVFIVVSISTTDLVGTGEKRHWATILMYMQHWCDFQTQLAAVYILKYIG